MLHHRRALTTPLPAGSCQSLDVLPPQLRCAAKAMWCAILRALLAVVGGRSSRGHVEGCSVGLSAKCSQHGGHCSRAVFSAQAPLSQWSPSRTFGVWWTVLLGWLCGGSHRFCPASCGLSSCGVGSAQYHLRHKFDVAAAVGQKISLANVRRAVSRTVSTALGSVYVRQLSWWTCVRSLSTVVQLPLHGCQGRTVRAAEGADSFSNCFHEHPASGVHSPGCRRCLRSVICCGKP